MLNNEAQFCVTRAMLNPISAANTAAATSAWVDMRDSQGDIMVVCNIGAMTGSITWTMETATDGSGTGSVAITPNEGAFTAGAANLTQKRTIPATACKGFVRIVGTIVTGPVLVSGACSARPHYA